MKKLCFDLRALARTRFAFSGAFGVHVAGGYFKNSRRGRRHRRAEKSGKWRTRVCATSTINSRSLATGARENDNTFASRSVLFPRPSSGRTKIQATTRNFLVRQTDPF